MYAATGSQSSQSSQGVVMGRSPFLLLLFRDAPSFCSGEDKVPPVLCRVLFPSGFVTSRTEDAGPGARRPRASGPTAPPTGALDRLRRTRPSCRAMSTRELLRVFLAVGGHQRHLAGRFSASSPSSPHFGIYKIPVVAMDGVHRALARLQLCTKFFQFAHLPESSGLQRL